MSAIGRICVAMAKRLLLTALSFGIYKVSKSWWRNHTCLGKAVSQRSQAVRCALACQRERNGKRTVEAFVSNITYARYQR